jgi:subtilisin-like proprotein convertase family protein
VCLAAAIAAAPASAGTYSNATPIHASSAGSGPATPYPSLIEVTGEAGITTKVTVSFTIDVAAWRDIDALLVGPGGNSLLLSDVCDPNSTSAIGVNLTFDDDAPAGLACPPGPSSGTYKPTNFDTSDSFVGVAPPYLIGLGNFRGVSPNGVWQLYLTDDTVGDQIDINGGWTLNLTTTGAPAQPPAVAPTATPARKKCKKRKHRSASAAKKHCKKKR